MKVSGFRMATQGVLGLNHKKNYKNLFPQNHLPKGLEIWYVALPSGPSPSLMKVPASKMALPQGVLGLKHRNT